MAKFEVGKKYYSDFIGDRNLHGVYTVVKRSAKFVTFEDEQGHVKRYGLDKGFLADGREAVGRAGEYIKADKPATVINLQIIL